MMVKIMMENYGNVDADESLCDDEDDDAADDGYYELNLHDHDNLPHSCHYHSHICSHDEP